MKTQTNTDQATARPLYVSHHGESVVITAKGENWIVNQRGEVNPRHFDLIVAAVNQYEAHRACVEALRRAEKQLAIAYNPGSDEHILTICRTEAMQSCNQARAALAQLDNTKGE